MKAIYILLPVLLLFGFVSIGQNHAKERSFREVKVLDLSGPEEVSQPEPGKHKLENPLFAELLWDALEHDHIQAYKATGDQLDSTISVTDLLKWAIVPDTIPAQTEDGGIIMDCMARGIPHYRSTTQIALLLQWSYDSHSGETTIKPIAIGPFVKVYDRVVCGKVLAVRPMYWVRYDDARRFLAEYEAEEPINNLSINLWERHFSETNKN